MKNKFGKLVSILVTGALLWQGAALADTISFEGTVAASQTCEVYAFIGGTVSSVEAEVGQQVAEGDVLATLNTTKVYAAESGVVTGVFGQIGDSAETIAEKYGAVMYIEGESVYSIAASTENAYNETENKFVHVGESVYLSCYSDGDHTGTGVITAIEGADYTVKVLSGEFLIGETVNVYRGDAAKSANRIGRGKLSRTNPTAVSGSGSIVSFAVSSGDTVHRGDLLFETLDGEFDGLYMRGNQILAETNGTVAELKLEQGGKVEKNSVAAVLYPAGSMRIEAQVDEADLASIAVGDPVTIELLWNQDEEITYEGTISMISAIANSAASQTGAEQETSDSVTFTVYVDFTPDANTRYGMSALVSTIDTGAEEAADDDAE